MRGASVKPAGRFTFRRCRLSRSEIETGVPRARFSFRRDTEPEARGRHTCAEPRSAPQLFFCAIVTNLHQIESFGRGGRAAGAAIARGEGIGDIIGLPAAEPDQL